MMAYKILLSAIYEETFKGNGDDDDGGDDYDGDGDDGLQVLTLCDI